MMYLQNSMYPDVIINLSLVVHQVNTGTISYSTYQGLPDTVTRAEVLT